MTFTRDDIIDACNRLQGDMFLENGLCWAFYWDTEVTPYLEALGASKRAYKWTKNEQGREQRLLFLAFMLTWHDDLTGYGDD